MKKVKLITLALLMGVSTTYANENAGNETYTVDTKSSVVSWKGSKVIGGGHHGTIDLSSGSLILSKNALVGGKFTIDMTSINCQDLSGGSKTKLEGHLSTGDFFTTDKFPTASLEIKSVDKEKVTADLTIKGTTKEVSFPYTLTSNKEGAISATGKLTFDRTKFGVVYGSGNYFEDLAKNRIISDDIVLEITLEASK